MKTLTAINYLLASAKAYCQYADGLYRFYAHPGAPMMFGTPHDDNAMTFAWALTLADRSYDYPQDVLEHAIQVVRRMIGESVASGDMNAYYLERQDLIELKALLADINE